MRQTDTLAILPPGFPKLGRRRQYVTLEPLQHFVIRRFSWLFHRSDPRSRVDLSRTWRSPHLRLLKKRKRKARALCYFLYHLYFEFGRSKDLCISLSILGRWIWIPVLSILITCTCQELVRLQFLYFDSCVRRWRKCYGSRGKPPLATLRTWLGLLGSCAISNPASTTRKRRIESPACPSNFLINLCIIIQITNAQKLRVPDIPTAFSMYRPVSEAKRGFYYLQRHHPKSWNPSKSTYSHCKLLKQADIQYRYLRSILVTTGQIASWTRSKSSQLRRYFASPFVLQLMVTFKSSHSI